MVSGSQLQPAHADTSAPTVPAAQVVTATQPEAGASADEEAIADAAESYVSGDAKAAAALADAASAADALPMAKTTDGLALESDDGTAIEVAKDGDVTLSAPGVPEIGLSVAGDPEQTKVVGGALVQTEVAPSTDVVTRATGDGVQVIAILADENAPTEVTFPLTLPDSAKLMGQADGSISVVADVTTEIAADGEAERVAAAVDQIVDIEALASGERTTALTEEQKAALEAIPDAATTRVTETVQIATIGVAWAVDANGAALDTHYEITGDRVRQVIKTNGDTAFPVIADPDWTWVLRKALECSVGVASITLAAAPKVVAMAAKVIKLLKAAKSGSSLKKAYDAWQRLGSTDGIRLGNLMSQMSTVISLVKDYGFVRARTIMLSKLGTAGVAAAVLYNALDTIMDVLGLSSCVSLMTGKD